jgi:hypothetical protein
MSEHNPSRHRSPLSGNFWTSRAGRVLIAFAAVAALLLVYEHRVHLFTGNGLLVVLLALCVGMHFFMHGGHGGHGGGNRNSDDGDRP